MTVNTKAEKRDKTWHGTTWHALPSHNTPRRTPQCGYCADSTRHRTSPPTTNTAPYEEEEGAEHCEENGDSTRRKGQHNSTPLPPFNGTTMQTEGGHRTRDGEASNTAALPSPCHPPSTTAPHHHDEEGAHRGYPTTRTPQTHTHRPHTTHLASNSTRHDSSTRQHCNGMSRARAIPLHWAGQ